MPESLLPEPSRAEQMSKLGHLSMRSDRAREIHFIGLSGELDLANAAAVDQELIRVEATDAHVICLDLSALTFIDSAGIRLLIVADARSRVDGNRLTLLRPPDSVLRVLLIAGVADRLPFVH
jgi:anti-anti-sigma factor